MLQKRVSVSSGRIGQESGAEGVVPTFMGVAKRSLYKQNTPAAHELGKGGREVPTPDQQHAFRSFSPNSLKDFAGSAESRSESVVESRDDSIARQDTGVGQIKTNTMRTRHTDGRDEQDRVTTGQTGEVKEPSQEIFSPSPGARASPPTPWNRSDVRKQPRERLHENRVPGAVAYYYYCNLTPCYVVVGETGGFLTACYLGFSEVGC